MANTEGVNIVISGDASQAEKAIKDVSSAIDGVKGTDVKITADASQAIGEAEKLASTVENINDAHAEITADSSQAVGEADKASSAMENVNDAHAEITADGSQAVDEANKVANAEESIKDAHSTITADGSQALEETEKVKKVIADINGKKVTFTISPIIKDAQGRLRDIHGRFLNMGNNAGKAFSSGFSSTAEQGISNSVKNIKKSFDTMLSAKVGSQIAQGFETALTSITGALRRVAGAVSSVMKSALSIGGGFEAQITNVKVISGATEKELDMLIKKAREMGATLPITAKDAATAMQLLAQRGTSAKDILASVSEVANLTISQGVDMGSAADLLGSTMTNFGIAVDDASKITAIFNNACNQSALSMSKLIEAMKYVGPNAGAMKMSLTEAVATMEALANSGLTGEMIGTGLTRVLAKLSTNSHIMGVKVKELDGSLRPLRDIFIELNKSGFSAAEAEAVFGARGKLGALALSNFADKLAENEERLKNWGSTQAAVDAKAKTFTNTMAALRSAIEEFHIEIFEQIKDQSKEAVGGLAELTRAFSKWVGESQIAGKALNSFLDGLGFKIPSSTDFESLLKRFDVQAFVNKVKDFGSTLKGIGESIASMFDKIKTPLSWLIEHLDTFAQISFWGWILGKGLQIPAAIMSIVFSFNALTGAVKGLLGLSWASLAGLLTSPIMAGVAVAGVGVYAAHRLHSANEQLSKALDEEKRYLQEQAKADVSLPVDIDFNFKTGFEKLPESWTKASDKVRAEANATVKELQDNFRVKVAGAVDYVARKFPDMADAILGMGTISDSALRQISAALHGDEAAFEALPEHLKKITEHINAVDAGLTRFGVDLYGISKKYREFRSGVEKPVAKKDEGTVFFEELSASIKSIMTDLPAEIERANNFLHGTNGQLAVQVSLTQAQNKLDKFVKSASEKYALPQDIVKSSVFQQLERLAQAGDNTAQSLVNGWKGASNSIDTFIAEAKDAINYLGASPEKFTPALNKLMKGIQKIDPITGKVTEQFKKAHDVLKQWGNTTFNDLMNRIGKLRKAVEKGFIDESYLEYQIEQIAPKIKLQILQELEPMREQMSEKEYLAVVASEFYSKIEEAAGDAGAEFMHRLYDGMSAAGIGHSIVQDVAEQLGVNLPTTASIKVNGQETIKNRVDTIEQKYADLSAALKNLDNLPQNISNAIEASVSKSEKLNPTQDKTGTADKSEKAERNYLDQFSQIISGVQEVTNSINTGVNSLISTIVSLNTSSGSKNEAVAFSDYHADFASVITQIQLLSGNIEVLNKSTVDNTSAITQLNGVFSFDNSGAGVQNDFAPLVTAVQNLSNTLNVIQGIQQSNASAFGEVINAVRSVEAALKSVDLANNYDIDINQQGFIVGKQSDADNLARSTANALRVGIGNGGL